MIIDAHQHFWQLSQPFDYRWLDAPALAKIRRDYLPSDLKPLLQQTGVDKSIFVQTQHNVAENRWVLQLAAENDFIAGVVGWVDLQSPDVADQLAEFQEHPKFVGVRHVTHDEPDDDFIIRPAVLRGLQVLEQQQAPFDLLFYVKHLKHAATVAKHVPALPLVIDHLAKPKIKEQSLSDWLPDFQRAAQCENVYCKLSGMITEADWQHWKPADLKPYIEAALECFTPDRLMFGTDWPVCELAGSYAQVVAALQENIASLSTDEQAKIMGGTAARFYGIE